MNEIITIRQSRLNQKIKLYAGTFFLILWVLALIFKWDDGAIILNYLIGTITLTRFLLCKIRAVKIYNDKIEYWSFFSRKIIYNFKEIRLTKALIYSPISKFEVISQNNQTVIAWNMIEITMSLENSITELNKQPFTSKKITQSISHTTNIGIGIALVCVWFAIFVSFIDDKDKNSTTALGNMETQQTYIPNPYDTYKTPSESTSVSNCTSQTQLQARLKEVASSALYNFCSHKFGIYINREKTSNLIPKEQVREINKNYQDCKKVSGNATSCCESIVETLATFFDNKFNSISEDAMDGFKAECEELV